MAKNYNLFEVAQVLSDGTDMEAVMDITRRFGPLAILMTKIVSHCPEDALAFLQYMPEHITANKINTNIKNGKSLYGLSGDELPLHVFEDADDEDVNDETEDTDDDGGEPEEKPAKKTKVAKKTEESDGAWVDTAKGPDLFKAAQSVDKSLGKGMKIGDLRDQVRGLIDDGYLDENGERTDKEYGSDEPEEKPVKKAPDKKTSTKKVEESEEDESEEDESDDDESDDDEEEDDPKKAVELFKQCRKLGLKVKAKQTAKFYQEKIDEYNASKDESEDNDDEDDDWDI